MPRLSLWRPNHSNDYKFFDKTIFEQFTVGGTDINIHKYIGPVDQGTIFVTTAAQVSAGTTLTFSSTAQIELGSYVIGTYIPQNTKVSSKTATTITLNNSTTQAVQSGQNISFYTDATKPSYINQSEKNIQDLLFLENRDRKYDSSIYTLRGMYRVSDTDFDLSQFGLFLTGDTIFMTFHLNDMVEKLGRKLMVGDVLELPHLKDYYPLNDDLPTALKRYYVVQDATKSSEGFSPTWWPHLWRVKVQPLVNSQEYKDIINHISASDDDDSNKLKDVLNVYDKLIEINDAVVAQATNDVPESGYDTTFIYTASVDDNGMPGDPSGYDASNVIIDASNANVSSTDSYTSPTAKVTGYLTGDGSVPNGRTIVSGIAFPSNPSNGDYYLRLDYLPNRLFRYDGRRWVKVEDDLRANIAPNSNETLRSSFRNNYDETMQNRISTDVILCADPYTVNVASSTSSFTLSTKSVVTKTPYVSTYGVKTYLNGVKVTNTVSNTSGNIGFSIGVSISSGDRLEWTVYQNVTSESQPLSQVLRIREDN